MIAFLKSTNVRLGLVLLALAAATWWMVLPSDPEIVAQKTNDHSAPAAGKWSDHDGASRFAAAVAAAKPGDWAQLVREALDSGNDEIIKEMLPDLLRRWMQQDMRGFLAFINELEVLDEDGRRWAILGPMLLSVIPELGDRAITSPTLSTIIHRTILNVARHDPNAALDWAQQRLAGIEQDRAIAGIVPYLVEQDVEAAKRLTADIDSTPSRLAAQLAIGNYLGAQNSAAGLAWANSLANESDRAYALAAVLSSMAGASPHDAGEIYRDSVSKIQQAFTNKVLAERQQMGLSTGGEFEDMTPAQAERALRALPDPNLQYFERAAIEIGTSLVRQDPAAALQWAKSLSTREGGDAALASVYGAWVSINPGEAWAALRGETNPSARVVADFFESWATKDPASASSAIAELSGTARLAAIQATVTGWSEAGGSTGDLVRWAGTLSGQQEQDQARGAIASTVAFGDPVVAWQQVQQMKDPQRQAAAFSEVFPSLADVQPLIAQKAVASLPLSKVQKDYFNSLLEPILNP